MTRTTPGVSRRTILAGLGCSAIAPIALPRALAQSNQPAVLIAASGPVQLARSDDTHTAWRLSGTPEPLRFNSGSESRQLTVTNRLPAPLALSWRGLSGAATLEPLLHPPIPPGSSQSLLLPMSQAGTFLCEGRILGDTATEPFPACPVIISNPNDSVVDRDEVLLIEDWRIRPDGSVIGIGRDPSPPKGGYSINGGPGARLTAQPNDRLRIRLINASQRIGIAVQFTGIAIWVMAIDSQPSEPFLARDGRVILASGSRFDLMMDLTGSAGSKYDITLFDGHPPTTIGTIEIAGEATRPAPLPQPKALPQTAPPGQPDLRTAVRQTLAIGEDGSAAGCVAAKDFSARTRPLFSTAAGRTVVLALSNQGKAPQTVHLHGHHARLLDQMDDGWKPYWTDTVLVAGGRTERIAFRATNKGDWLVQLSGMTWMTPSFVGRYTVT